MNESPKCNVTSVVAFGSLALNIFLVAFVLGHNSAPPPPPPFEGGMHRHEHEHGPGGPGPQAMAPAPGGPGMAPPPGGPGAPPPPPPGNPNHHPFIASEMIFTPQEMDKDKPFMDAHFEKVRAIRQDLAAQLEKGNVSADMLNAHFAQVQAVMDEVKQHLHQEIADKIQKMTPEERNDFARKLADMK